MPYKDPEKQRASQVAWAIKDRRLNPEKYRASARRYKNRHREKVLRAKAIFRAKNRKRLNAQARIHQAKSRENDPLKIRHYQREYALKAKYGLSLKRLADLLEVQKGKCPICCELILDRPCVDHCHRGGHVRAILCVRCNSGIAMFRHSYAITERALKYLGNEVLWNGIRE